MRIVFCPDIFELWRSVTELEVAESERLSKQSKDKGGRLLSFLMANRLACSGRSRLFLFENHVYLTFSFAVLQRCNHYCEDVFSSRCVTRYSFRRSRQKDLMEERSAYYAAMQRRRRAAHSGAPTP